MHKLVLQGHALSAEIATEIALKFDGKTVINKGFIVIQCRIKPEPAEIQRIRESAKFDINLLPTDFDPSQVKLVISDMDSTLIKIECIDEIADFAGLKPAVSEITEAAMRGELDFAGSLKKRVGLLKGLSTDVLARVYEERLLLTDGAETLLGGLKQQEIKFALVSGGFTFFTERLKQRLNLDFALANQLSSDADGNLDGTVTGNIVDGQAKAEFLRNLCEKLEISPSQTVAIGDGANDLLMMGVAGLGVAFHAKPTVQQQADCALNHCGLEGLLGLLEIEPN